jgi:hypothetical protein
MQLGWCQLRQLPIHPDLVAELWCPHWTARPPRLPSLNRLAPAESERPGREEQLSLAAMLIES